MHALKEHRAFSDLPRTISGCGYRIKLAPVKYSWSDSLCIMHASKDDWIKESTTMKDVCKSQFCTIAATRATDANVGCVMVSGSRLVHASEAYIK